MKSATVKCWMEIYSCALYYGRVWHGYTTGQDCTCNDAGTAFTVTCSDCKGVGAGFWLEETPLKWGTLGLRPGENQHIGEIAKSRDMVAGEVH